MAGNDLHCGRDHPQSLHHSLTLTPISLNSGLIQATSIRLSHAPNRKPNETSIQPVPLRVPLLFPFFPNSFSTQPHQYQSHAHRRNGNCRPKHIPITYLVVPARPRVPPNPPAPHRRSSVAARPTRNHVRPNPPHSFHAPARLSANPRSLPRRQCLSGSHHLARCPRLPRGLRERSHRPAINPSPHPAHPRSPRLRRHSRPNLYGLIRYVQR